MKKLLSLALALTLMLCAFTLTLTSCLGGDGEVPVETLEELNGKSSDEIFAEIQANIANFNNYTIECNTTGGGTNQVDVMMFEGDNQQGYTTVNGEYYNQYWWANNYFYGNSMASYGGISSNGKVKGPLTKEQFNAIRGNSDGASFMNYPLSWFEDMSIQKEGDAYYLKATINGEKMNEYLDKTPIQGDVSNINFKLLIDAEGSFLGIEFRYTQTYMGHAFNIVTKGKFKNIGTTTVTTVPENPETFTTVSFAG